MGKKLMRKMLALLAAVCMLASMSLVRGKVILQPQGKEFFT